MDENFLLQSETAQKLYHSYAADAPILDYHCHINPQEIYEDRQFENITQVWLGGDHYKWRFMRSCGVDEKYITDHYEMRILLESEAAARAAKNGMPEADKLIEKLMDGSDSYELVQEDPLTMTAGTYSHPKRGSNYDEQSKEFRERTEQELKFGRSRGDR